MNTVKARRHFGGQLDARGVANLGGERPNARTGERRESTKK
jgi:hypothetical protein